MIITNVNRHFTIIVFSGKTISLEKLLVWIWSCPFDFFLIFIFLCFMIRSLLSWITSQVGLFAWRVRSTESCSLWYLSSKILLDSKWKAKIHIRFWIGQALRVWGQLCDDSCNGGNLDISTIAKSISHNDGKSSKEKDKYNSWLRHVWLYYLVLIGDIFT